MAAKRTTSTPPTNTTKPARRGVRTVRKPLDPRVKELADQVHRLADESGVSGLQLAQRSGVDQSQLSKWWAGKVGLSIEQILNLLQALQAGWAISRGEQGDVRRLPAAGTVDAFGTVRFYGGIPSMPALFLVDDQHGPFRPGDRILIEPGAWTAGKYALVKHPDGSHRIHKCEERNGLQLLVGAESILFDEARHEVMGIAVDRIERL